MEYQRIHKSSSWNPPVQAKSSPFSLQPYTEQTQQDSHRPPTQEEIENKAFDQNKFEAFGLQLKEKRGTITPVGQERLGVLQANMADFRAQRRERASRFGHNFANIPAHAPDQQVSAPVQPCLAIQSNRANVPPQSLQQRYASDRNEGMDWVQRAFPASNFQHHPMPPIQAKLTIRQPNEQHAQEANALSETLRAPVASQGVEKIQAPASAQSTPGQSVQRQAEKPEELQAKPEINPPQPSPQDLSPETQSTTDSDRAIQGKGGKTETNPVIAEAQRPNQTGLPDGLKSGIESLSGIDLDGVKVHYNSSLPAQLNALAYTQGSDIHVAPGQERHLPHEAWHVVQQTQGRVKPTMQLKDGVPVNDDEGLEHEANLMGAKALGSVVQSQGVLSALLQKRPGEPLKQEAVDRRESQSASPVQAADLANISYRRIAINDAKVHYDSPMPVQMPTQMQAHGTGAVVQCWLNQKLFSHVSDGRIKHLSQMATDYNANRKGKTRTKRIDELNRLQVALMQKLDELALPDQNVSNTALWVKNLMNNVQQEHELLVKTSIEQKDQQPPVANFDKLSADEQALVQRIWTQLVNGIGNIRITEDETYTDMESREEMTRSHEGFRYEALAQFARLLETATGRDIVNQVNRDTKGKKLVTIKPGFAEARDRAPSREFAAGPNSMDGSDKLTKVDIDAMFKGKSNANNMCDSYRRQFVEVDLAAINDAKQRAAAIYQARQQNPRAKGLKIANQYYKFGKGTSVDVTMTRDIRDAEDHHTSRFVDQNRNEIPTPNFITLGHELGHAAHMLTGVALGDQTTNDTLLPLVDSHAVEQDWSDLEEYANINSVENAIRGEFGMKDRYGHINQASVQKGWITPIVNDFYTLSDTQPTNLRKAVEAPLGQAGSALAQLTLNPARKALINAATIFVGQMDNAFPGFTNPEKQAITTQLTQFKTHIESTKQDDLISASTEITQATQLVKQAKASVQRVQQQRVQQQRVQQQQGVLGRISNYFGF